MQSSSASRSWLILIVSILLPLFVGPASAADTDYVLGAGDVIRISVFQNPDLTTEARVAESGSISFPLIGTVAVGGSTIQQAEQLIARLLRKGGFVIRPQVNILPLALKSAQVAVLGRVNRAGRFPLETANARLSEMVAAAGGIAEDGSDVVVLLGSRNGQPFRREINLPELFRHGDLADDLVLQGGDVIFVGRAETFYIYGEVQRPGAFRLGRDMTVMQGLATGGGTTARGTIKGLQIHRRDEIGRISVIEPRLSDHLQPNDVIYVRESLF
ncbi:MAG: polysaccharide export protein EpsE [Rhodocyclaceae bacterium]|nr:polysaccharide export protein EpsE [Rhodocyclaceae bacterium]